MSSTLTLKLAGVERVGYLVPGSLSVTDKINERSMADFDIVVKDGSGYRPTVLDAVMIKLGSTWIFGGFVWDVEERIMVEDGSRTERRMRVACVDNHLMADRRLAANTYESQTAAYIVGDLRTNYLSSYGVTAGTIQTGATVVKAVYNYKTVAQALDELAEASGYYWRIWHDKTLDFADRTTFTAPWNVTTASSVRGLSIKRTGELYRNRQFIRAGFEITASRTEQFAGDGKAKAFTVSFAVAKSPTVTVNGSSTTVGIRGLETGKDWYWSKGEGVISQDDSGTVLISTDTLAVTYQGMYPVMTTKDDASGIASYGEYEQVEVMANLDGASAADQYAQAKLRRYARIAASVSYDTDTAGLAPGQLQTITIANLGVSSSSYLISEVHFQDFGVGPIQDRYRYKVTALDGEIVGGWESFFRRLAGQSQGFQIRENEVLVKIKSLTAQTVTVTASHSYTKQAPETKVGTATIGFSQVG